MIVPYGPVTSSNNVEVNIAIQNAGEWQRFCTIVLTDPTIAEDPRFSTNESRVRNRESLDPVITAICGELTDDELRDRLARADIPYGNLNDVRGLLDHKQLEARQRWGSVDSEVGPIKALLHPMNLDAMPQRMDPVPSLGEHTTSVLESLGYDADAVASLAKRGIV